MDSEKRFVSPRRWFRHGTLWAQFARGGRVRLGSQKKGIIGGNSESGLAIPSNERGVLRGNGEASRGKNLPDLSFPLYWSLEDETNRIRLKIRKWRQAELFRLEVLQGINDGRFGNELRVQFHVSIRYPHHVL